MSGIPTDLPWREVVPVARKRGYFTPFEVVRARRWCTCAVGEQHLLHPSVVLYHGAGNALHITGVGPCDPVLLRLGGDDGPFLDDPGGFFAAVRANDFDRCERILDQIEDRVLELKREST